MLRPNTFAENPAAAVTAPREGRRGGMAGDLIKGAIAGVAATWLMNHVTTWVYAAESEEARARENLARGGQSALANAADRMAGTAGLELSDAQKPRAASALHFAMGAMGGAAYAVAQRRWPSVARANGLPFGIGFFLLVDETMNTALGFTPGPRAFPWQAHARGAAGHVVFGLATHGILRTLDRLEPRRCGAVEARLSTL